MRHYGRDWRDRPSSSFLASQAFPSLLHSPSSNALRQVLRRWLAPSAVDWLSNLRNCKSCECMCDPSHPPDTPRSLQFGLRWHLKLASHYTEAYLKWETKWRGYSCDRGPWKSRFSLSISYIRSSAPCQRSWSNLSAGREWQRCCQSFGWTKSASWTCWYRWGCWGHRLPLLAYTSQPCLRKDAPNRRRKSHWCSSTALFSPQCLSRA